MIYSPLFAIVGFVLWLMVFESGVHATIAGVVMGLLTPATPLQTDLEGNRSSTCSRTDPIYEPTTCAKQRL